MEEHLCAVAMRAREFADSFGAGDWGFLGGLWHDLGKYSADFQRYLRMSGEDCAETQPGRVDHSTAGAQHGVGALPLLGHLIAYGIAGHHSGLLDGRSSTRTSQLDRLAKSISSWEHGLGELPPTHEPAMPDFLRRALAAKDAFAIAFFARMVFSCLVDSDFLDTERFMQGDAVAEIRRGFPDLRSLLVPFLQSLETLSCGDENAVTHARREVRDACEAAAAQTPGFFSLTVPTGGGKTLSSLAFALRHAERHGLRRIVYVAPFLGIIEQNADVWRRHLGDGALIEHHSNLDMDSESEAGRLAAENWDAPVIVTTAVQFHESLFANRTSTCRKLHRLVRSIVILDEAQTLPVHLLQPCLRALQELTTNYGSSVVLCTATQPGIRWRTDFDIGLREVREIMPDPPALYERLRRVEVRNLGVVQDGDLATRLAGVSRVLCIVNTTRHARDLFRILGPHEGHFHLSARMCAAHRREVLDGIRARLDEPNAACRVVSTQVVEAGVDVDFPVVYRALAGLDSLAQAAGRCNRNGRLSGRGEVFVFRTEHAAANRYFAETANCAAQVFERHADDLLSLAAVERYFRLYYWDQKSRWDERDILGQFRLDSRPGSSLPFDFGFAAAAERFRLIDDAGQRAVIVPWGEKGAALCARLRAMTAPNREVLREAQRYTVQVRLPEWNRAVDRKDIRLLFDNLGVLESREAFYDAHTGLNLEAEGPGAYIG